MGSDSDLPVMQGAIDALSEFGIATHVEVVSAHRAPEKMARFSKSARSKGLKVIIAGAGGAAHLPGMVAAQTTLPVIGVPVKLAALDGMDSLLSIVQMPRGVPVACVAINNGMNAGLLAVQILAATNSKLSQKLDKYRKEQAKKVANANKRLASKKTK